VNGEGWGGIFLEKVLFKVSPFLAVIFVEQLYLRHLNFYFLFFHSFRKKFFKKYLHDL